MILLSAFRLRLSSTIAGLALIGCVLPAAANDKVHVSRFWHNHQPTYWPEWNSNGSQNQRVQYAWDSIVLKSSQNYGGLSSTFHPENNLTEIFGVQDRDNSYQSGPRNSLANLAPEAGFALSFSGSLMDGVRQLCSVNQLGYGSGWWNGYRESRNWLTPSGSRRMDLVGFTYHHSLAPLLPKSVLRKEIQTFKQAYWKAWGANSDLSDHSKGFFPTEMGYSRHIVDVLVDEGYEWVIVPSHHISRTSPSYTTKANPEGSFGINSSPPNKADQIGPEISDGWWYGNPQPGIAAWNVSPYAYQLHKVKGAAAQMAHIEDGAWIFPESCYGSPYFLKWIEPPLANAAIGATNRYPGTTRLTSPLPRLSTPTTSAARPMRAWCCSTT